MFRDLTYFTNSVMQTYIRSYYSLSWSFCSFYGTRRFHDHAHSVPYPVPNKYNPHPHVPIAESTRSLCSDCATDGHLAGPGDSPKTYRPAVGPSEPPVPSEPRGPFPRGLDGRSVKLTTHLHLMPKLRMYGTISPLPHMLPLLAQGQLYP